MIDRCGKSHSHNRYVSSACVVPQLIPLYVCTALGCGGAVFYLARLALRSPDVSWQKHANPEPWEEYRNKQYKVRPYSIDMDSQEQCLMCKYNKSETNLYFKGAKSLLKSKGLKLLKTKLGSAVCQRRTVSLS